MDKESARRLIKDTFQNPFDKNRFIYFVKNLLNHIEEKTFIYRGKFIPDAYKPYISAFERIGKYEDDEKNKIDILIVQLKKETSLERARTMQRNFIAWYLNGSRGDILKDAALVAFISPNEEDWRFSLVKMEYKFEKTPKGDVKVKEEFTPARRYSFLVGKNESSHTAQSCFVDILISDIHNLKLNEIEEAFSIEKVTKEFFEKYRNLFFQVKDALGEIVKKDEETRQEFQEKGVNIVDFSKKLLGQIVFLYFLQKKGWFGVKKGQKWGLGSKHFLRELFEKKHCDYKNFFNNVLEPLFYEALRNDRSYEDHYFSYFNCKIPFLNGGLFDPINDYDWAKTDILLPDTLFSNQIKTKEGDIGKGILDVFDRYNFTVKEDEPLEKEVAVDPEMLGKVFENLLEVKDRKSKGTYYTPREIVHYMCQQSLINYLYTEVYSKKENRTKEENIQMKLLGKPDPIQQNLIIEKDSNINIEKLIKYGDTTIENDNHVVTNGEETKTYSFKLPENIRKNAEIIDEALKNIRVCDPAIGSGAFPVGMMNEIIRARNVLTSYLSLRETEATKQSRTMYNFKRHAIQNCLYGVDIDPGAVEIAKLRLWLSLIVDEEDINKINPLPNLDYKIMQGNSLISEFMGIDLDKNKESDESQLSFTDEIKGLYDRLKIRKDELLNQSDVGKKKILKNEIENLIIKIFEIKLQEQKSDYFKKIRKIEEKWERHPVKEQREKEINREKNILFRKTKFNLDEVEKQLRQYTSNQKIRPFFPWKLYFSEIFQEKDGFDVVIANPPYIVLPKNYFDKTYRFLKGNNNTYVAFLESALKHINDSGVTSYIIPTTWLAGNNFKDLRKYFLSNKLVQQIIQLPYDIFEKAYVDNLILILTGLKFKNEQVSTFKFKIKDDVRNNIKYDIFFINEWMKDSEYVIYLNKKLIQILSKYRNVKSIKLRNIADIQRGTLPPKQNELHNYSKNNKQFIPWFDGQVYRYFIKEGNSFNVIYKNLKENKPLELFTCEKLFGRQLISRKFRMQFSYFNKTAAFKKNLYAIYNLQKRFRYFYILALLNSTFYSYVQVNINTSGQRDDYPSFSLYDYRNFLIPDLPIKDQTPYINFVIKILHLTQSENYLQNTQKQTKVKNLEEEIDQLIYKLYNLTPEEIEIVEGFKNK